jgi:hypothetical protein
MASPGLVPGEPRFCTRTDRCPNGGVSARLTPAERKIFATCGERKQPGPREIASSLGSTGTRPVEAGSS